MTVRGEIDLGTDRVKAALALLDHPQNRLGRVVHVTGTNGKGSVCELIARSLGDLKVGLFTSPFIVYENDSIRVIQKNESHAIPFPAMHELNERIEDQFSDLCLTDFERLFLVAVLFFASQALDVTVIEVGVGGRDDATNVFEKISPICVLTSVSLDHQKFLGDTTEEICRNKCGIIQDGSLVFANRELKDELKLIVKRMVVEKGARFVEFVHQESKDRPEQWRFSYRSSLFDLARRVVRQVTGEQSPAMSTYTLPGRLELRRDPILPHHQVVLDGAHNDESASALRQFLDSHVAQPVVWIIATSAGREHIVPYLVRFDDSVILIKFRSFQEDTAPWIQCASPDTLRACLPTTHQNVTVLPNGFVEDALELVSSNVASSSTIVIGGSLYLVRNYLRLIVP
jgi:folylpolyglutamate synthase/dihydropteroate synthase